jgi:uncharacterized protein YbjT (DUF2867 family)
MEKILVTGATGNIGGRVVRALASRGARVRAFVRKGERVALPGGVEVSAGDYRDEASLGRAMHGVDRAYVLSTGAELALDEAKILAAAAAAKVKHLVKHSVLGAPYEGNAIARWHRESEKRIEASGVAWTFLRPASFATNALGWAASVAKEEKVYGALGGAALPVVDPDDVAEAAAIVLTTRGHEGRAYDLTGPEALTTEQQVQILARALDRPLAYVDVSDDAARAAMLAAGMDERWVAAMVEMIGALRALGRVEPAHGVKELTGHEPGSFASWARANAAAFRGSSSTP